jgi:CRP/FNR family transcriptional regulator, cyclic AMP receptor protein
LAIAGGSGYDGRRTMAEADSLFAKFGKACPAGTVLFREGDSGSTMFVIHTGKVAIVKRVRGDDKTLAVLGPGEFFGEMAILNAKPRTATAEVLESAQLLEIDAKRFEQMVVSNAEIAVRLIKRLARRLEAADELIEIMMHRDPRARFILGLSRQADLTGQALADGSIHVPITQAALAEELGVDAGDVADIMRRIVRLGIVDDHGTAIVIRDRGRLHEYLEFLEARGEDG